MTAVMGDPAAYRHMLAALAASPRFRGMRVCSYAEETDEATEKQFSAVTFRFPDPFLEVRNRSSSATASRAACSSRRSERK